MILAACAPLSLQRSVQESIGGDLEAVSRRQIIKPFAMAMTTKEMKQACKDLGLKQEGTKFELAQRLNLEEAALVLWILCRESQKTFFSKFFAFLNCRCN